MKKMVLCIDTEKKLVEYTLNKDAVKDNRLDLSAETEIPLFYLTCEPDGDAFILKSNDYIRLSENHIVVLERKIAPGLSLNGKANHSGKRFTITVREIDKNACIFRKFDISRISRFTVGSGEQCDIVLKDNYVSREHLVFQRQKNGWTAESKGRNGSFLNGKRLENVTVLNSADCISVLGYKFYFLGEVIAVNAPLTTESRLLPAKKENIINRQVYSDSSHFSKAPRMMEPLDTEEISVEAPPPKNQKRKTPFVFVLGPTLTMPIPILTMVLFNMMVTAGSGDSALSYIGMVISVIMFAVIGAVWAIARHKYDEQADKEEEKERIIAYKKYIADISHLLREKQKKNKEILEKQYISSNQLLTDLLRESRSLWNRNVNHPDFLCVRLGTGSIASPNPVITPKERFSVVNDVLAPLPAQVKDKYALITPVPKLLNLKNNKIIGLIGDPADLQGIVNNLILQIIMLHAYTDVQLAFLKKSTEERFRLDWVRWLPHVFNHDKSLRLIADNTYSRELILFELVRELRKRKQAMSEAPGKQHRFKQMIVFSTDRSLMENQSIYPYMTDDVDYGITFVLLYGKMEDLPNECRILIENTRNHHVLYRLDEAASEENAVLFEQTGCRKSEKFARNICGLHVSEINERAIPDRLDYFEALQIGDISQWDLLKHYRENRSYEGIRAYIGIGTGDHPVYLDIHEKKSGPHGLIAGTTGSGKSELIQTFILSLALNYHPDEVAFILIDYKGGGMANVFTGMPHLAGTITNLGYSGDAAGVPDENLTRRTLIAFRSEIKRRQKVFNRFKVAHIDHYMRLYREKKAEEAMPHLIIISDEFAELKKEQPDFIKELISTARVGRSLGIHLILATQKPGGVVDDEIWANARFKLCLRVQDRQDSMGMLKRPEAAELIQTGRAYMQIGNDEIFEQFQTAYSGAGYYPRETLNNWHDDDFNMICRDGTAALVRTSGNNSASTETQLEAAVRHIVKVTEENRVSSAAPLWLPPLSGHILLDNVSLCTGELTAAIGLIDDPENQAQYPFTIDFKTQNHLLVIGQAGCGKSVLLQTLLMSMFRQNLPSTFQFYGVDYSAGQLGVFKPLPHCGGIVFPEETEKLRRLFQLVKKLINLRKTRFSEWNISSFSEIDDRHKLLPMILIVIDGYFEMMTAFPESEEILEYLLRDSARYGIQFVVSTTHVTDMRYKVRQNFGMAVPLQLQEKGDYLDVLGQPPAILPTKMKGRGLYKGRNILEFQTLLAAEGKNDRERYQQMLKMIRNYAAHYAGTSAEKIPEIPYGQGYRAFYQNIHADTANAFLPLGYYLDTIEPFGLDTKSSFCFCIGAAAVEGLKACLNNLIYAAVQKGMPVHFIQLNPELQDIPAEGTALYQNDEEIQNLMIHLKTTFKTRSDAWKAHNRQGFRQSVFEFCRDSFTGELILIDDFGRFEQLLYETAETGTMDSLFELFLKEGKGYGIYFAAGFPATMDQSLYYMPAAKLFTGYDLGVYFGGRLDRQSLFSPDSISIREQMAVRPPHHGYAFSGGVINGVWQPVKQ